MVLNRLQQQLQALYELEMPFNVSDFLISHPRESTDTDLPEPGTPETLYIHQSEDDLAVGLYLEEDLVERLEAADPTRHLHDSNLADFWTALEGVSHFVYFAWNAAFDREISCLELELQAEVDKYVVAALLLRRQLDGELPRELHSRLFAEPRFREQLSSREITRYVRANQYASRYCRHLERRLRRRGGRPILNSLRRFYRLTHWRKLSAIEQLPA